MPSKTLTELEQVILGVVGKFGPLTSYAVGKHFTGSPAARFSRSAGSLYPAMARLRAAGLLRARDDPRGRQGRTLYALAAAGRRAHLAWMQEDLESAAREPLADPLRTRLYFLGLLPSRAQRRFLERAIEVLEQRLPALRSYARSFPGAGKGAVLSRLAAEGLVLSARARLAWLRKVQRELFSRPGR